MAGMGHHRQGDDRQHSFQQHQVVVREALRPVGREGVADARSARRVAIRAKADDLGEIIGGAGVGELLERGKIELRLGSLETTPQMQPRLRRFCRARRPRLGEADQVAERAVKDELLVLVTAFELPGLNGVEIAPPHVAVPGPLRMQCAHPGKGAPQRHTGADEAPTQAIEQQSGVGAAQTLADGPDVHFDDLLPERAVEAQRQRRHLRRARPVKHERRLYPNLSQMRNRLVGDDAFVTSVEPSLMIDRWR